MWGKRKRKTPYGVWIRVEHRDQRCPPYLIYLGVFFLASLAVKGPVGDAILVYAEPILHAWDWLKSHLF